MINWLRKLSWVDRFVSILLILALISAGIGIYPHLKISKAGINLGYAETVNAAGGTLDYYFTGTSDNTKVTSAIAALPATGGEVFILTPAPGQTTINFSGTVSVPANVEIRGSGMGTSIVYNGSSPCFTSTGNGTTYENLKVDAGGITTGATTGWLEINVAIGTTLYTERSPNSSLTDTTFSGNVSATTVGATTLNAPTGRTASYVMVTSSASSLQTSQADKITNSAADIQTALTDLNGTGIHSSLELIGDFTGTAQLNAVSNVDVFLNGSITVTSNLPITAVTFDGITNSTWSGGSIIRNGTIDVGSGGYDEALVIQGACDNSLKLLHMTVSNNTITTGAYDWTSAVKILTNVGGAVTSPYLEDVTGYGSTQVTTTATQNIGIHINGGQATGTVQSVPLLVNCKGYAGVNASGWGIELSQVQSSILKYCIGYAGNGASSSGIDIDSCTVTLIGCIGYASDGSYSAGISFRENGSSSLESCIGTGGGGLASKGIELSSATSPTLTDCISTPKILCLQFPYNSANNGRVMVSSAYAWSFWKNLDIYNGTASPGVTLDIGTTIGGHEIRQNIDLSTSGAINVPVNNWANFFNAGTYIYFTTSSPIANGIFNLNANIAVGNWASVYQGLYLGTTGKARIVGGAYYGCDSSGTTAAVNINTDAGNAMNWSIQNALLESNYMVITADNALSDVPIYNCQLISSGGGLRLSNILSFAQGSQIGTQSGTWTITNGNTSVAVTGVVLTPQAGDIAIGFSSPSNETTCYVDTYIAGGFTVHVNAASTGNTTGWWKLIR